MRDALTAEPLNESTQPVRTDWGEPVFVWGVWAAMLISAFWFARSYGNPVPFIDEWAHIEILTGEQQVTAEWLWKPHGEHRIPLAKLLWISVIKSTGSFKAGVYINVLLLGMVAWAMIRAAQKLPGGLTFTDALLPMLWLHVGQGYNLQWWWQIMENLPSVVIGILIVAVVRGGPKLSPSAAMVSGACLMLLPFCGPSGLPCALAMSLWLGTWGVRSLFGLDGSRVAGAGAVMMAAATLASLVFYFIGLQKPDHMPASPGHWETTRTALQFLSVGVGAGGEFWWTQKSTLVCLILLTSCIVLAIAWWSWPGDRVRIAGLLLLTSAAFPLALSLGWGRAYNGDRAGLSHWYTIFGVSALCAAYFAWRLYAPPTLGRFVRVCFFAGGCMMLALNMASSCEFFASHQDRMSKFMADLNDGVVLPVLADRHMPFLFGGGQPSIYFAPHMKQLHDVGYPVFRSLNAPELDRFELPFRFERANQATWQDGVAIGSGADPFLVFTLEKPQFVYAIQLWFSYRSTRNPVTCEFYWCDSRANNFGEGNRHATWIQDTAPALITRTIVVNETIDKFRIDPADRPCEFRLWGLFVLSRKATEDQPPKTTRPS